MPHKTYLEITIADAKQYVSNQRVGEQLQIMKEQFI